jgi:selenocysteine lyase/cysteine desulfurase
VGYSIPWNGIALAQSKGWDVLVDCAAFVPTNRLDLSQWHPDFVPLSFYKIFGYPTGVGCLIVRKVALAKLQRPWYAGGTIVLSSVITAKARGEGFYLKPDQEGFEDGTLNYLSLPAVEIGLKHIENAGIDVIDERVRCLTGWLLESLQALHHSNGMPVAHIYGPTTPEKRGGTIAFNLYNPAGHPLDCYKMQEEANSWNISLRSGCFCNPGVREISLQFAGDELMFCFQNKEYITYEEFLEKIDGRTTEGAPRVSIGLVTNFADVYRFLQFVQSFVDRG